MDGMRRETKALKVILSFETLKREEKRKPAARLTLCEGNGSSGRTGSGRKRQRDIRLRPAHLLGDRIWWFGAEVAGTGIFAFRQPM